MGVDKHKSSIQVNWFLHFSVFKEASQAWGTFHSVAILMLTYLFSKFFLCATVGKGSYWALGI